VSLVASGNPLVEGGETHGFDRLEDKWATIPQKNNSDMSVSGFRGQLDSWTLPSMENLEDNITLSHSRNLRDCVRSHEKQNEKKETRVSSHIHVRAA